MSEKDFNIVYIEISNVCNLQCSFCPAIDRKIELMSLDHFKHIVAEVLAFTDEVALHQMGDPLMHPHLKECLHICEAAGIKVNLTTNGTKLLQYDQSMLLLPVIRQINFSLQSYEALYTKIELDDYLNPIFDFTKKAKAERPDLYINYRLWNEGVAGENDMILKKIETAFDVILNRQVDVGFKKSKCVTGRLYLHFDSRFEWPDLQLPVRSTVGFCHALSMHIAIQANGDVVPCCLDKNADLKLGNILTSPLKEILSSKRASSIKAGFARGERCEDLCQRCQFIDRFQKKAVKRHQKILL